MNNLRKDLIKIVVGNILLAAGYGCITIPNKIVNGSVTSFSLIISNISSVGVSVFVNAFTLMLLAVSCWKLGKENFLKTLVSSLCYLALLNFVRATGIQLIIHPLAAVAIASIAVGLGYYFCVSANASTAGFDVIALIVNKKNPKIEIGTCLRYISILVLVAGYAVLGLKAVMYGIVFSILESQTLNIMTRWEKRSKGAIWRPIFS